MNAQDQHREVWKLLLRLDTLRIGLRDRMSDGVGLVEELEEFAAAAESLAAQASELAARLDADLITESEATDAAAE
jgi:hypothetical protein